MGCIKMSVICGNPECVYIYSGLEMYRMPKFRDPRMRIHMRISVHEDPRKRMHMQILKDGDPRMRMQMRISVQEDPRCECGCEYL